MDKIKRVFKKKIEPLLDRVGEICKVNEIDLIIACRASETEMLHISVNANNSDMQVANSIMVHGAAETIQGIVNYMDDDTFKDLYESRQNHRQSVGIKH